MKKEGGWTEISVRCKYCLFANKTFQFGASCRSWETVRNTDGWVVNNTYNTWQPSLTPERWIMLAGSSPPAPAALKNKQQHSVLKAELSPCPREQVGVQLTQQWIMRRRVKSFLAPLDSTIWAEDSRKRKPLSNRDFTSTWIRTSRHRGQRHQAVITNNVSSHNNSLLLDRSALTPCVHLYYICRFIIFV